LAEYIRETSETSMASDDLTKYLILSIVGLLILIKLAPLVLEYTLYIIQVVRMQRFKRAWSQKTANTKDKQVISSAALEFYETFKSDKGKFLVIDFLWQTAEFDSVLINRLTELAEKERNNELSDRIWNLIYELETREQRVA